MHSSAPDIRTTSSTGPDGHGRFLAPAFTDGQRRKYRLGVAAAALAGVYFWAWWLQPSNIIGVGRFVIVTLVLMWIHFLIYYFFIFFLKSKRPCGRVEDLGDARVAMIVTKTPAEPLDVLKQTLTAMIEQDVPHDTWLADEDPQPETIAWCWDHGVKISSRKNRAEYHRATWPRRTRCKEGNLAFFYDQYGYENYDFVAQLDADHVPEPGYLRAMLRPFVDPEVGYVSAPSICSNNAKRSWAARTRLFTEALFHGIFQAGYSSGWAPMCIGSHYAVRTKALHEVGGLGPELAEDHSTSMILNAGGWRGVHAIDAVAYGAGPDTVADMVTQEFQWSRSLMTLLLSHTPRYLKSLKPRLRFQFLFSQLLYPMIALANLAMYLLPIVAIVFDLRYANVTYPQFVLHSAPQAIILTLIVWQVRRDGLLRPLDASIISWEKILFVFLQWPWVLFGCAVAIRDKLTGSFVDFRITPKGDIKRPPLPLRILAPYAVLAIGAVLPVLLLDDLRNASGFYLLSLLNALIYTITFAAIVKHHYSENAISWREHGRKLAGQFATAGALGALVLGAMITKGTESLHTLTIGLEDYQITELVVHVSGAGREQGRMEYRIKPELFEWPKELLIQENSL